MEGIKMSKWVCPLLKAEDDWTFQETADLGADFHLINSFNDKWFAASDNPYELIHIDLYIFLLNKNSQQLLIEF